MYVIHNLIDEPIVVTTFFPPEANVAELLADAQSSPVGKGNPFYVFESLSSEVVGADFSGAPVCSNKADANQAAIDEMLASPPLDRITAA